MDSLFEMTETEKQLRWNYLHGDQELLKKPMRMSEYSGLGANRKTYDEMLRRYHAVGQATMDVNTILDRRPTDSEDYIDLARHLRYSYPLMHNHDYVELIYVYQGECLHFIEEETLTMKDGDFCLLKPNSTHALSVTSDDTVVLNIIVSQRFISQSFLQLLRHNEVILSFFEGILYRRSSSPYIIYPTGGDLWMHNVIRDMYSESLHKDYLFNASVTNTLRQVFIHLLRKYELSAIFSNPLNHQPNSVVIALINYIAANYDHITLKSTAEHFGYNSAYLSQMLKEYTGKSFTEMISDTKISNARRLLSETTLSVTEISYRLGYYDASHFAHQFKKASGQSPAEYRRSNVGRTPREP